MQDRQHLEDKRVKQQGYVGEDAEQTVGEYEKYHNKREANEARRSACLDRICAEACGANGALFEILIGAGSAPARATEDAKDLVRIAL